MARKIARWARTLAYKLERPKVTYRPVTIERAIKRLHGVSASTSTPRVVRHLRRELMALAQRAWP